jgi:hypothetical protein
MLIAPAWTRSDPHAMSNWPGMRTYRSSHWTWPDAPNVR